MITAIILSIVSFIFLLKIIEPDDFMTGFSVLFMSVVIGFMSVFCISFLMETICLPKEDYIEKSNIEIISVKKISNGVDKDEFEVSYLKDKKMQNENIELSNVYSSEIDNSYIETITNKTKIEKDGLFDFLYSKNILFKSVNWNTYIRLYVPTSMIKEKFQ